MNYFYEPSFTGLETTYILSENEFSHAKVLRLAIGDSVSLLNGIGVIARCQISEFTKKQIIVTILNVENYSQSKKLSLAVGILDNKDRMEFLVEKATELGVHTFIPLITQYSAKSNRINTQRLESKMISAMKQSGNPFEMKIVEPFKIEKLSNFSVDKLFVADYSGNMIQFEPLNEGNNCVVIGPEGGFTPQELELFRNDSRTSIVRLNTNRLRTETAAIALLSKLI